MLSNFSFFSESFFPVKAFYNPGSDGGIEVSDLLSVFYWGVGTRY